MLTVFLQEDQEAAAAKETQLDRAIGDLTAEVRNLEQRLLPHRQQPGSSAGPASALRG